MKISLRLASVFVLLASAPCHAQDMGMPDTVSPGGAALTLSDTLSWMDYTYNPHSSEGSFGHGIKEVFDTSGNDNLFSRVTESFSYHDCQMILSIKDDPNSTLSGIHTSSMQSFNLADIDAKSIQVHSYDSHSSGTECSDNYVVQTFHMECDTAEITFNTNNDKPSIAVEAHSIDTRNKSGQDELTRSVATTSLFEVNNTDYANRFAKSFAHAVALCSK